MRWISLEVMLQAVVSLFLVLLAFVLVGIRVYRFVRSVRTKGRKGACADCPLVSECTSNVERKGKCNQIKSDMSKGERH